MRRLFVFFVSLMLFTGSTVEPAAGGGDITLTVVYDNYVFAEGTRSDWGFSCLIEGTDQTILFDTGTRGDILLGNMEVLGIDPAVVDIVVLSHIHGDHVGGLDAVLEKQPDISVYFGDSFPASFTRDISGQGARPVRVRGPVEICPRVFSTGEIEGPPPEQALVLDTQKGLIVITGCSHPGIVTILKRARELFDKEIYLACGGFHLAGTSEGAVRNIIANFKKLGVQNCGPTHCTGDRAIALFREAYGKNCIPMGVGRVIRIEE
ncbi:MAG: MBL fold metallo-hydrolase [Deltaproteobacteria bacterium]|nr:MBL fold metallo-hydrolase [Deltaproteobacteria bacterium]